MVYGVYQNRCLPGAVVFADQDQLTIDEADKIKEDQGAALTAVFESGMVKANMIASGSWPARVRIMMLMNPNKKNCGELMHQCAYLLETFEEKLIRRIDIAMHQEVLGVTTSIEGYAKPKMLTEDLAKVWINFAWSRKPEDIEIQTETLRSISQQALNLSRKFSNRKIKLLNQSDAEDNLVRLSVAYAIFDRSFTVTGKVIVLENHVNLVCELLERIYCNELFALDKYSSFDRSMVEIDSKDIKIFDKYFNHLSDDDKYSIKDFISKICRTRMRASSLNAMPATRKNKICG